ncbi:replication protein A 70 kDa DNA-binding subunit D-like [Coffea arabica]|uniref:Replication protein A 70 kDa DNA-binding subunit D-like n=1 Tax=Coffea arabica TaxID=13443 RepID=A0A6P6WSK7_COFAR|nr:replication protein A 70 kDa DNA-binding subunit B-like [Coffea arabica]
MVINEGQFLQQVASQKPAIAAIQIQMSEYQGEFQLSTTFMSTLKVNPNCKEVLKLQKWITTKKSENIEAATLKNKMDLAEHIQLKNIIHQQHSLKEHAFYTSNAIVNNIENKVELYYNACKGCSTKIINFEEDAECPKCNHPTKDFTSRYNIRMEVVDGQDVTTIILFEDLASNFIGCPIQEYIDSTTSFKDKEKSKLYKKMIAAKHKEFKFLIKLNKIGHSSHGHLSMVAIAFEQLPNTPNKKMPLHLLHLNNMLGKA